MTWANRVRVAEVLVAIQAAMVLGAIALNIGNRGASQYSPWDVLGQGLPLLAFALVGAAILTQRADNPLAWLFCLAPFGSLLSLFGYEYGLRGLVVLPGTLPLATEAAWLHGFVWAPSAALLLVLTLLLFPDGHPPSPGWRWVAWAAGTASAAIVVAGAVLLWPERGPALVTDDDLSGVTAMDTVVGVAFPVMLGAGLAAAAALVTRFRRSHGVERQQLRWFAVAAPPLLVAIPLTSITALGPATEVFATAAFLAQPLVLGLAVLRYRLYDLDRLLSRTATYALLTLLLGAFYLVGVTLLGRLLDPVTGESPLAVAAATLAVAALVRPLRARLQDTVDRRFNRRRRDARLAVEGFRAALRDELHLAAITDRLAAVADQAVQPASTSVWLLPASSGRLAVGEISTGTDAVTLAGRSSARTEA